VSDLRKELSHFLQTLSDHRKVFEIMSDFEMLEWIWKLYTNMVQISGISNSLCNHNGSGIASNGHSASKGFNKKRLSQLDESL